MERVSANRKQFVGHSLVRVSTVSIIVICDIQLDRLLSGHTYIWCFQSRENFDRSCHFLIHSKRAIDSERIM